MPVVPSYGGDEEYSQQRQLTYQPTRGAWPAAAPRGLRPIGGNVFGGNPFGAQRPRWGRGCSDPALNKCHSTKFCKRSASF